MTPYPESTRRIAKVISKLLHPYVCLPVVVALIAYQASPNPATWTTWTMAALLLAYLPPLLYSYRQARVTAVAQTTGQVSLGSMPQFVREHPNELSVGACLFGVFSVPILYFLNSPPGIIATIVGATATMLLTAQVNRIYRSSLHLAFFTSMTLSLGIILSIPWLFIAPFIVVLGVSRYHLGSHTPAQLGVGLLIGLAVTIPILNAFGFL